MADGATQLRLLLWKDYLLRKRKPVTIAGIVWATATLLSLVIVRKNIYAEPKPSCLYPARALPSAGLTPFLQSFICSVSNDCVNRTSYQGLPDYSNARLKQYQTQLQPLFENSSFMEIAESVPGATRLLTVLTTVIDQPLLHQIAREGLKVSDIFKEPEKTKKLLRIDFNSPKEHFDTLFDSNINFENIIERMSSGEKLSCNIETVKRFFNATNESHIDFVTKAICGVEEKKLQQILNFLLMEIDVRKYLKLIGDILNKLNGNATISNIGDMADAVLRLTSVDSYIPQELQLHKWLEIDYSSRKSDFSYVSMDLVYRFLNVFEPMFRESETFKSIRAFVDVTGNILSAVRSTLDKTIQGASNANGHNSNDTDGETSVGNAIAMLILPHKSQKAEKNLTESTRYLQQQIQLLTQTIETVTNGFTASSKPINVIDSLLNVVANLMPKQTKNRFFYYITLINKMLIGAHSTVRSNLHMEEIMYQSCKRHPEGVRLIRQLGPNIVSKIIDGLADGDRVQALTRKIKNPGQIFCDLNRIQIFLKISKNEATVIRPTVCNSEWRNFITDVIDSFGVYNSSKMINEMASMVVSDTLGKNVEDQFVEVRDVLNNVTAFFNFVNDEQLMRNVQQRPKDWKSLFNNESFADIINVLKAKARSSSIVLVTVHSALAREIIAENSILETYITPTLIKVTTVLTALSKQIDDVPQNLMADIRKHFVSLTELTLATLHDKEKTLNVLTEEPKTIFCGLAERCGNSTNCRSLMESNHYVVFPSDADPIELSQLLCQISSAVTNKLQSSFEDDKFIKLLYSFIDDTSPIPKDGEVNWTVIIKTMQQLYNKMDSRFGFIFNLNSEINEDVWSNARLLSDRLQETWLMDGRPNNVLQLSVSLFSRFLDTLDKKLFALDQFPVWSKVKLRTDALDSLLYILNHLMKMITAFMTRDKYFEIEELPLSSKYLIDFGLNFVPLLRDIATSVATKSSNVPAILNVLNAKPSWPCSSHSLGEVLELKGPAATAFLALEELLCEKENLRIEWKNFQHITKLIGFNNNSATNMTVSENPFISLAANFNQFVDSFDEIQSTVQMVFGDPPMFESNRKFSLLAAWDDISSLIKNGNDHASIKQILKNIDTILNSTATDEEKADMSPPEKLWETAMACEKEGNDVCRHLYWPAVRQSVHYLAEAGQQVVSDLTEYFSEISEPDANVLQLMGFTKRTGPYIMCSKLPQLIGTLANSFMDQGFMKQVRQSMGKKFWNCEKLMNSLVLPVDGSVTESDIKLLIPYTCPSILHWVSVPTNENVLLDIFSKSQFFFYNKPASTFTGKFEELFEKTLILRDIMSDISKFNKTNYPLWTDEWVDSFKNIGQRLTYLNMTNKNTRVDLINSVYVRTGLTEIYLAKVTLILNDIQSNLSIIDLKKIEMKTPIEQADFKMFLKLFDRRPGEMVEMFIFAITESLKLSEDYNKFSLITSLDEMCKNESFSSEENMWLKTNNKVISQLCKCNYRNYLIMSDENFASSSSSSEKLIVEFVDDLIKIEKIVSNSSEVLYSWKNILQTVIGLDSPNPGESIKLSTGYARDLTLKLYLQYLDSRLQHHHLILGFVTNQDWWADLRQLYNGEYATQFLEFMEKSPIIVDDIFNNIAKIKIMRLLKDINMNDTSLLCSLDISEYIPDATGLISGIKESLCRMNETSLFIEIPSLGFADQVYADDIIVIEESNEEELLSHLNALRFRLAKFVEEGPQPAAVPKWISETDVVTYQNFDTRLTKDVVKVDLAFLILTNVIDASTLFLNTTYSSTSSIMTPWVKQINLQLIKTEEYASLICELPMLNLTEIHSMLVENFHWDLALNEITSGRNYTSAELNKSLNELLNIVRLFMHDSFHGKLDRTRKCLLNETSEDPFSHAAMYITLGSRVMKLIRSMSPHFNEISGFQKSPIIQELMKEVSKGIPVTLPIEKLVVNSTIFKRNIRSQFKDIREDVIGDILKTKVDVNKILLSNYSIAEYLNAQSLKMEIQNGTSDVDKIFWKNVKKEFITKNIDNLRSEAFWSFEWLSGTVLGVEKFLEYGGKLMMQLVPIDMNGMASGRINSTIDFILQLLQKNYLDNLLISLNGMISELHPLLNDSHIENDLISLSKGLESLGSLKDDLLSNFNMKFQLSDIFRDWNDLKLQLQNNLNISARLADDIQNASIDIGPLLKSDNRGIHISEYICKPILLKKLIYISQQSLQNISDTFCEMDDVRVKNISLVFLQKVNFNFIIDIVMNTTMKQLMRASRLTEKEGEKIIKILGEAASLLPALGPVFTNLSEIVENEPLVKSFQNATGVSSLLANPDFFVDSGKLVCGKPFYTNINRFYRVIAATKDNNINYDQKQLDSLPTDYCRNLYKEIVGMGGGKILWSYAKPLLMGKILYTPDTPRIQQIIKEANSSFSQIGQLTSLLKGFSEGFESLDEILVHKESLSTMQKLMKSSFVRNAVNKIAPSEGDDTSSNVNMAEINLDSIISQFKNSKDLGSLISKISEMTDCISLDRFVPAQNELSLETRAASMMKVNEFMAGLVFLDTNERSVNNKLPTSIKYKIRMDIDNVPSSSRIKNRFWTPNPEAEFIDNLRYFRGFVQLQDLIDKAIISTSLTDRLVKRSIQNDSLTDLSSGFNSDSSWGVYTQQIPYPCWIRDDFQTIMYESQALIVAFFFCLILTVSSIVRSMVWERESGNTDLMCVMGMRRRWHTLSWFVASAIEVFLTMGALCFVLKVGGILPNTNAGLLYLMLLNFGFSIVMFCYLISALFRSASLGAVSAAILYLLSFMPYVIVIAMEASLSLPQKLFTSLSMSTGFCYGILFAARYEVQGSGLNFQNFWNAPDVNDSMSVALSTFMVLFDSVLYGIIAWAINSMCFRDSVATGEIKTEETSIGEIDNSDQIGVRITKLTKKYGERRALDNVSLDLKRGHITTLLGHNGAGKTTLIKIITGMIKQDSGKITINDHKESEKGTAEWETVKNHIGLCPQFDVLLEDMTAREHLVYYAQLKTGNTFEQIKYEVDSMSDAMGLGTLADEPVRRLSGGLRRRLAVGLAFIARPHVVVLDEPSSGVDPVARRGIWSLIVGLKAHRTVLLTTHHLDEAELLSDTVVIMHKGKVRATGSPLGLKHKYGDGYKITLTYQPLLRNPALLHRIKEVNGSTDNFIGRDTIDKVITKSGQIDLKHKSKCLMACVNEFVKNPSVPEIKGNDIQVNLPFLDASGLNNDFLSVTNLLENKKTELEYSTIGVDCSNLEQVFLSICGDEDSQPEQNGHANSWIQNSIDNDLIERCDPDVPDNHSATDKCASDASIVSADIAWRGSNLSQLVALLHKRFLHYRRSWWLLSAVILLPAIFVTVAMAFSLIRPPPDSELPISLSSQLYSSHSAEFIGYSQNYTDINTQPGLSVIEKLLQMSTSQGKTLQFWTKNDRSCKCSHGKQRCLKLHTVNSSSDIEVKDRIVALPSVQETVKWLITSHDRYIEKRYGGWSALESNTGNQETTNFIVWYNNKGHHSLPAYLNALNNAILRKRLGHNNINITTYSHPLKLSTEQLSQSSLLQHVADVGISIVLVIGFSLVAAGAAVYLVMERTEQQKRLQLLCGVRPLTYWLASLIWDVLIIVVAIILSACILEIFGLPVYVSRDNLPAICLLLLLYGFSSSSLVHLLEKLFNEGSLANMIIFCCNVFVAATGLTILLIIDVLSTSDVMASVRRGLQKVFMIWPQFALGDALVEMSKNTIQADILQRFGMDTYEAPLGFRVAGHHCIALVISAIFFFLLNLAVEVKLFNRLFQQKYTEGTIDEPEDCDVATERYRVELSTMKAHYNISHIPVEAQSHPSKVNGGEKIQDYVAKLPGNDVMQTLALRKEYNAILGTRIAVHNLTFGVRSGQCLGLLGVNGAGKSTTFKMLTGELRPTAGHIFLAGKRVTQQELCDGSIAYCPQNDALDPLLTLTEHLQFYCKLRGIKNPKKSINKSLEDFELNRYASQRSTTLSGGNKRKLCTAIALLGHAPLVLLDEPTSGMDPVSRGRTGAVLRRATDAGRALLLSTHSLSDCEALCHVAALTSHGRFQAMGPPHHLKLRFGGGYLVSIRLENPSQRSELLTVVSEAFPGSELQTFHYCTAQFLIHLPAGRIFAGLASIMAKLNIIDYSINQSSLDQVFVNFSHSQTEIGVRPNGDLNSIKLSTLERQYSQPKIYPRIQTHESSPGTNVVTKL